MVMKEMGYGRPAKDRASHSDRAGGHVGADLTEDMLTWAGVILHPIRAGSPFI